MLCAKRRTSRKKGITTIHELGEQEYGQAARAAVNNRGISTVPITSSFATEGHHNNNECDERLVVRGERRDRKANIHVILQHCTVVEDLKVRGAITFFSRFITRLKARSMSHAVIRSSTSDHLLLYCTVSFVLNTPPVGIRQKLKLPLTHHDAQQHAHSGRCSTQ